MLRQREALIALKGVKVTSVNFRGDDDHLRSFVITTADGTRIDVCVFLNYLRVGLYTPSEVENMEW